MLRKLIRKLRGNEPDSPIDELLDAVYVEMQKHQATSEEYQTLLKTAKQLNEIKTENRRKPVSSDAIAGIVGNLLIAGFIVVYEQKHIANSRGWGMLLRPKSP